MRHYLWFIRILVVIVLIAVTAGCTEKDNSHSQEGLVSMILEESSAGYLKIRFEPAPEVAYYCYGQKNGSVTSNGQRGTKTKKFGYLNPNTEYYFTVIAYDSNNVELSKSVKSFRTTEAPYDNYYREYDNFYKIISADMYKEKLANEHYKKNLRFNGTGEGYWFQVSWVGHAYESVDKVWNAGTYQLGEGGGEHVYWADYNTGKSYISTFGGGTMKITKSGSTMNVVITDNSGVKYLQFAGSAQ